MNNNIAIKIASYLDSESKYNYLNYYYQKELNETGDEEYVFKLECLYEWWEEEQRALPSRHLVDNLEWDKLISIREQEESIFENIFS